MVSRSAVTVSNHDSNVYRLLQVFLADKIAVSKCMTSSALSRSPVLSAKIKGLGKTSKRIGNACAERLTQARLLDEATLTSSSKA